MPNYKVAEMEAIARQYGADYIFCDHPYMAFSAITLSKKLGIPWFMRSHNIESDRFRTLGKPWWKLMHWFEKYAMKKADGIFFVTPEDLQWSIDHFGLSPQRCHFMPFGTETDHAPTGRQEAKRTFAAENNLDPNIPWLYTLGTMNYGPNIKAVEYILDEIMPRLDKAGAKYQVLVAGRGLPQNVQDRITASGGIMKYMGFIPVLHTMLNACDIMLNPLILGGGIKTKAVEALCYNKIVVSTKSGAAGVLPSVCGDNLVIVDDSDWDGFANSILTRLHSQPQIPKSFFDTYYWGNVAKNILAVMQSTKK